MLNGYPSHEDFVPVEGRINHNTLRRKDDFSEFIFSKKVLIKQENEGKGVNNVEVFATSIVGTLVTTKKSC